MGEVLFGNIQQRLNLVRIVSVTSAIKDTVEDLLVLFINWCVLKENKGYKGLGSQTLLYILLLAIIISSILHVVTNMCDLSIISRKFNQMLTMTLKRLQLLKRTQCIIAKSHCSSCLSNKSLVSFSFWAHVFISFW